LEFALENILESFIIDGLNRASLERLLENIYSDIDCPYVLFFFKKSISNQKSNVKIKTTLKSLDILLRWYAKRHYDCIHPNDISIEIPNTFKIKDSYDYPEYSIDDWSFRGIESKSEKSKRKDKRRRSRILKKGNANSREVIYTPYSLARGITHFARSYERKNKNASIISSLFNTNEYFGFFAFPYFEPSKEYSFYRAIGSILWSVISNQNLHTLKPPPNDNRKFLRFEDIFTFTSYNTEFKEKNWRIQYLNQSEIKDLIINSSAKYENITRNETFPLDEKTIKYWIAPLRNYVMSFNFGLEAPPDVLPSIGWDNLIKDYHEMNGSLIKKINFKNAIILESMPTRLWK
jgi:hypothetical protein